MTKQPRFTDEDAAALVDCAAKIAKTTATDDKGPQPLAASGRTSVGDRRAMVLAAHKMGYRTNFDKNGDPLV